MMIRGGSTRLARWCSTATIAKLQKIEGHETVEASLKAMSQYPNDLNVHIEGLKALSRYDTTDEASALIMKGWKNAEAGVMIHGADAICKSLETHIDNVEVVDNCLRLIINLCMLTIEDSSRSSNQSLLGAEGAVSLASQALHKHGRSELKVCSRALHCIFMLTMFNEDNTKESLQYDVIKLTVAMLSTYPTDGQTQDLGLALLLRMLSAPLKDNPEIDHMYEKDPLTTLNILMNAVKNHPENIMIQDKVWNGLSLLAHNHATLPAMAEALRGDILAEMVAVLRAMAGKTAQPELMGLRDQMLINSAQVVATILEGDTGDASTAELTTGMFTETSVIALNKGVSDDVDFALSSLLLSLSGKEDPIIQDESTMATVLTSLRANRQVDHTKASLRIIWNMLNYNACQGSFITLGGLNIVKSVPVADQEMESIISDITVKVRHVIPE
eukprot:TRINITY_DN8828_c0_g1_i2.p1 TRINITY_DN8828_c0_g1~~TRINITY_DN8828_c0_g1_i2.p1  ORF type:complete len:466 (+),score=91.55 TRINITY_DN8828_c0_g1_i2:68-1399(+)